MKPFFPLIQYGRDEGSSHCNNRLQFILLISKNKIKKTSPHLKRGNFDSQKKSTYCYLYILISSDFEKSGIWAFHGSKICIKIFRILFLFFGFIIFHWSCHLFANVSFWILFIYSLNENNWIIFFWNWGTLAHFL